MTGTGGHRVGPAATDETLMARYAQGDPGAFDELFRRYEPRAYAFFLRRTGSPQRAEDLYQELFLRIHRARDLFDPTRPFAPWFFQIASRLLVDDNRRSFRSREVSVGSSEPSADRCPDEQRLVDREEIAGLLEMLSTEERSLVLSSRIDGISYAELAEQFGKSTDAVKKVVSRAVLRLRTHAANALLEAVSR